MRASFLRSSVDGAEEQRCTEDKSRSCVVLMHTWSLDCCAASMFRIPQQIYSENIILSYLTNTLGIASDFFNHVFF